jgi:hypothetical protein
MTLTDSQAAVLSGAISRLQDLVIIKRETIASMLEIVEMGGLSGTDTKVTQILIETEAVEITHLETTIKELRGLREGT